MSSLAALARHPRKWRYERARRRVAERYLSGAGIEIGALHSPFPMPPEADVRYVDRLSRAELRAEYPELSDQPLVDVDVIDDGETLALFEDAGVDFVIASHFLEHCEDPIGALQAHLRVVRPGGTVLLALPDRRRGVDSAREATSLEHIMRDHVLGPAASRHDHYRDWSRLIDLPLGNVDADHVEEHAAALEQRRYSIHFHCWTSDEFAAQLREILGRFALPARLVELRDNYHEFIVVLERVHY